MRRVKMIIGMFFVMALFVAFSPCKASAELLGMLDDVWFKMNVEFSGKQYDPATEELSKKEFNITVYLRSSNGNQEGYDFEMYTKNVDGEWELTEVGSSFGATVSGPGEKWIMVVDENFGFWEKKGKYIRFYMTAIIKIKKKDTGAFKSATFKTLGAEVYEGVDADETVEYYGGAKVKGESIKVGDLPFTPIPEPT